MSLIRMVLAAMAVCLAMTGPARAEPRELVVGVEELDYFPAYAVHNGEYVGAAREILDAFAEAKGYTMVYKPLPIKRLFAELLSGGIDVKFPDNPYWSVEVKQGRQVIYSQPVIRYIDGVLVLPELLGKGADSIRTLGTVSGFTPFAWMDRIRGGKVQVKENPRMELLLKQVSMGRIDGAYASVAVVNYHLDAVLGAPNALRFDPGLPHSRDHYMLSSVSHPEVVAEFDAWMAANQPLIKTIKERTGAERGLN